MNYEDIMKNYKLFWQYPVITEKTFSKQCKDIDNYIHVPWATIIDKKYNLQVIYNILIPYIKTINNITCCQHISFRQLIPLFKALQINIVYTPHKIIGEDEIDGINIISCPLYAVNIEDDNRNNLFKNKDESFFLNYDRKYLYSFQGAYNKRVYLTDIREKIFTMNHPEDTYIKYIGDWHFENIVYDNKQNFDGDLNNNEDHNNKNIEYNELLLNSRYTLCPSGSGPNSIRFWEALAIGSIPILLSDTLDLPENELWDKTIIRIKECDINNMINILNNITKEEECERRENCIKIYNHFKDNYDNINGEIIHYCCESYMYGCTGGVARYDYHISLAFPTRKFFEGPRQKNEMINYLSKCKNPVIITDNHLSCDIPNKYKVIIVHHGVAQTHAEREPNWNPYWKNLCCSGQTKMLEYRDPKNTRIISISQFCTDEFSKYYKETYDKFLKIKLFHTSELNETIFKKEWNKMPKILGNWKDINKGSEIIKNLKTTMNDFIFEDLNVHLNQFGIDDFNKRKQEIYINSDIFLQLSLCEGFSYSALDALLCGIPVISSNVGLFYNDIPEDCFVKINWERNNDIDYIKDKIKYAWENKDEIGKKGREWYLKNCRFSDWNNNMNKLVKYYLKV